MGSACIIRDKCGAEKLKNITVIKITATMIAWRKNNFRAPVLPVAQIYIRKVLGPNLVFEASHLMLFWSLDLRRP